MAAAALPGALTVYFSVQSGGYFPGAAALAAAGLLVLAAVYLALARRPRLGVSPALAVGLAALGAFAAWVVLSGSWSESPARALPEYTRALCYLAALLFFGLLPFSERRIRWMVFGLALGIAAVCVLAFLSRTAPDLVSGMGDLEQDRLSFPLDYWNALGLLAGLGIVLCGHLACASREHPLARVAGAAAVPLLTVTLYYTFSRGAVWATLAGVAVYLVLGRPRGLISGALATVPPTAVALMAANPASAITSGPRLAADTLATAHRTAFVVFGCVLAAGALRACLLRLDDRVARVHFEPRIRRRVFLAAGAATLVLALTGSAALHVPEVLAEKYRTFSSETGAAGGSGSSRFLSSADNGRIEHWEVALRGFRQDRLRGSGAGTYQLAWERDRPSTVDAHDGHSLYVETLGELGVVGLGLLVVCLIVLLAGLVRRARGPGGELYAALAAAAVAWALAASVDWVWEMPAITVWLFALGGAVLARPAREGADPPSSGRRAGMLAVRGLAVTGCVLVAILPARLAVSEAHLEEGIHRMQAGDCSAAKTEARRSLEFVERRAAPHHLIAWCLLGEGRPVAAVRALDRALRSDPLSWRLLEASAIARAVAGLDPRPALRRAVAQNPRNELIREAAREIGRGNPRARARAARRVPIPVPEIGEP